jgi:hypothetical protein
LFGGKSGGGLGGILGTVGEALGITGGTSGTGGGGILSGIGSALGIGGGAASMVGPATGAIEAASVIGAGSAGITATSIGTGAAAAAGSGAAAAGSGAAAAGGGTAAAGGFMSSIALPAALFVGAIAAFPKVGEIVGGAVDSVFESLFNPGDGFTPTQLAEFQRRYALYAPDAIAKMDAGGAMETYMDPEQSNLEVTRKPSEGITMALWKDSLVKGTAFGLPPISAYATGTIGSVFTRPTMIKVGESGPEKVDVYPMDGRRAGASSPAIVNHGVMVIDEYAMRMFKRKMAG